MTGFAAALQAAEPKKPSPWKTLDPARVEAIAALLPQGPRGFGPAVSQRPVWDALATNPVFAAEIRKAESWLGKPLPPWSDALYLDFSKTGARRPGERMIGARKERLSPLVWAECLENKGRFLAAIETNLMEHVREPTWTLPAHDLSLECFRGTAFDIDLVSSALAFDLAQALWLLGDRVSAETRAATLAAIEARVFEPFRKTLRTGRGNFWMQKTHNWNPVCLAGTVGAALAVLPERNDRAVFIAAGEQASANYLKGYTSDGYCTEGLGYWNYGMSRYITLRECLWQATGGRIDLLADARVRAVALYGVRMEMTDGLYPVIADCRIGSKPFEQILRTSSLALGLGLSRHEAAWNPMEPRDLSVSLWEVFPNSLDHAKPVAPAESVGLRSWFDQAGLLICRPGPAERTRLSAALKGGHNAEHHNHNDVGSFTLGLNGEHMVGDPGGPSVYTAQTFSKQRYELPALNSYGHPLPVIGGMLQSPGLQAAAKVLRADFSEDADTLELDITSAYTLSGLRRLERRFVYRRGPQAALEVRDTFAADAPVAFETALTTRAAWRRVGETRLEFAGANGSVVAEIAAPECGFDVASVTIDKECPPYQRVAVRLRAPLAEGSLTVTFRVAAKGAN